MKIFHLNAFATLQPEIVERTELAIEHEVSRFSKRIFIWTTEESCKEHGNHSELSVIVPLDYIRRSTLYRIGDNKRHFYLSTREIDLWDEVRRPGVTFGSRPTWIAKLEDNFQDRERVRMLVERIKKALGDVVKDRSGPADGWCSKDWVVKFIKDEEDHGEFCRGRLGCVRKTVTGIV
ncbi:hypothetical protein PGT21_003055 [Puccinia graminis f. sp. tritici]|uniref:Uncharacterized protein n=1 Tax=Puccinia graminis f. sp. tritici TaxID=56615 RepID=A0A5B0MB36_PUCGR|nr:hypothetical protein PGT21_003055 [Puccinia graminis f. sp. tritici]KAA1132695.1 hypothetical protein PGTUg99_015871 [Puccinia graminis f. sp. tritici]